MAKFRKVYYTLYQFFCDNGQSPHNINICHIISKIQNFMFNISYILFGDIILEHCFGSSVTCISNLVLVLNNKIVCSTIICFVIEEQKL